MSRKISPSWFVLMLSAATFLSVGAVSQTLCQEPPDEAGGAEAKAENAEPDQVDPYAVPDGTPEQLLEFIQTGQKRMKPKSREDLVRMFESIIKAAEKVLASDKADPNHRMAAVQTKLQCLGMLSRVGGENVDARFEEFVKSASENETPEIQDTVNYANMQRQLSLWSELEQAQRDTIIAEIKQSVTTEQVELSAVRLLMQFADTVAETADAPVAIELIGEALPRLQDTSNPEIAQRLPTLEGIARRLQLLGSDIELEGELLGGDKLDWSAFKGKVVLIDFWATECGPCVEEIPNVLRQYQAYHDRGFEVLGISLDEDKDSVEQFMADQNLPWTTLFDDDSDAGGWHHPMATKYGINALPCLILVDQEGKVVDMNARGPRLVAALRTLLGPAEEPLEDANSEEPAEAAKTAQSGS